MMQCASLGDVRAVSERVLCAFPSCNLLATLRAVNRNWRQHLHELLMNPDVRHSLGCHHWDGSLLYRRVDLTCSIGKSVEYASWVPGTSQLLCIHLPERNQANGGEFSVFSCGGALQNVAVVHELKSCYLVDVCFLDHSKFICVAAGSKEMIVIRSDLMTLSTQSESFDLDFGDPDIVTSGQSCPKLSPDGLFVAYPVGLMDASVARMVREDDEDSWDGEDDLGSFVVMVEVQSHRTLWKSSFGEPMGSTNVIGFVGARLLVVGEQDGHECLFLVESSTGTKEHVFHTMYEPRIRPHYCISPEASQIFDGKFIFNLVSDSSHPASLVPSNQQVCLDLPITDREDATFAWSHDGSLIFCIRGKYNSITKLDAFDAKTGVMLWRRNLGPGLGNYCAPQLSISSDDCCLAITKHGAPSGHGSNEKGIRILLPAIILL